MRTPSYRRHSSGQARVTIEGKTYYLGPYNTKQSRQEYDRLISEYLASGRSITFGQPVDDLTVSELMADYLRFAKKNYGESELAVIKIAMRPLRSLYGTCVGQRVWATSIQGSPRAFGIDQGSQVEQAADTAGSQRVNEESSRDSSNGPLVKGSCQRASMRQSGWFLDSELVSAKPPNLSRFYQLMKRLSQRH